MESRLREVTATTLDVVGVEFIESTLAENLNASCLTSTDLILL